MSLDDELIKAVRKYCSNNEKREKNIKKVQSLLAQGASANAADNCTYKPTVLLQAAEKGKKEVMELLLKHGANINNGGREGEPTSTPLHGAIENKHEEAAIFLIEKGANIHAKDQYKSTPLHYAAYRGLGNLVKLLLDKGANVHIRNIEKNTPLHNAIRLEADPQIVRLLLEHGSDINTIDNRYNTLISSYTIWKKPLKSFFLLLLFGADVNREHDYIKEKINNTPKLKSCLTAFEQIKAMLHLGKLIEANIKKEGTKAIASYINNEAEGQKLIEEFKTIKERCTNEQLPFVPECMLGFVEHITLKFLKSHIDEKTMASYLSESKDDIKIIKLQNNKTRAVYELLPQIASEKIVSYFDNDTKENVLLALSKKADVFLNELKNIYQSPNAPLAQPQLEEIDPSAKHQCNL